MKKTLIIAEVGSCHDGSLTKAFALIDAARDAGADVAKFQFWSDPDKLADRRRVPAHYREIYRQYRVIPEWLPILNTQCIRRGIEFMATTYLPQDVAVVARFVDRFKVASFEAADRAMVREHAYVAGGGEREFIVSLGMGGAAAANPWLQRFGDRAKLLHCVSAYPAPVDQLQLQVLRAGARHGLLHGLSDHTDPALTWTGALAVAAGATIVEAHIRLDDTDPQNPDAPHAMTPAQFDSYVRHIRFAETCLGDGIQQLQPCEREMAQYRVGGSS